MAPPVALPLAPYTESRAGSDNSVVAVAALPVPRTVITVPHQPASRNVPSPRGAIARRFCPEPIDSARHIVPSK